MSRLLRPTIRCARPDDLCDIAQLDEGLPTRWTVSGWQQALDQHHVELLVALCEREVLAAVAWADLQGQWELQRIVVHTGRRRCGVARALLEACLTRGEGPCWLEVSCRNRAAQALYRGFGFRLVSRRRRYYRDGSDALVMCRDPSS